MTQLIMVDMVIFVDQNRMVRLSIINEAQGIRQHASELKMTS